MDASDQDPMEEEQPPKRSRGRPKGSLNRKTIERVTAATAAAEREATQEMSDSWEDSAEYAVAEASAAEHVDEEEEEEPPEPPAPPPKPRKAKPKPVLTALEPLTYVEVLKRGLDIAHHQQRADRVSRYDSFFR